MSTRLVVWTEEKAQQTLQQRLKDAKESRLVYERIWRENERILYNTNGNADYFSSINPDYEHVNSEETVGINYAFKNYRFIHAQMSANPPSVIPRPTSNDTEDRRAADAADRLVRYALRQYKLQEVVDRATGVVLAYGTGFTKSIWDPTRGDPIDMDEETGEYVMEGDYHISVPNVWNMYIDPDADIFEDVTWVFEKILVPWEEACYKFPEKIKILKQYKLGRAEETKEADYHERSKLRRPKYDSVELYEYWEKGTAMNGFLGRHCICTANGELVSELMENPEQYYTGKKTRGGEPIYAACLPYNIMTDIDIPNTVWGKSSVEYTTATQDNLNRLDNVTLETAKAHGIPRLVLPEGAEIADGSLTNSPWDVVKVSGNQGFHFAQPMQMPTIVPELMNRYKMGIDDMSGVNEAMFGQQSRETSGFSMQYATNQGNMIRRRLFNKYVLFVENIYKAFLLIIQKNWEVPRTIQVLGKEKAFEVAEIKGADISGGYSLVSEYGNSLSLDPTMRREEILTLMPLFEKAGVEPRKLMEMLKLNELSGIYDTLELAKDRQHEIFTEMITRGIYKAPEELEDHKNMLTYSYHYVMTTEFKHLPEEDKVLIRRHIREREDLAAQQAAPAPEGAPPGLPPGLGGMGGLPGM